MLFSLSRSIRQRGKKRKEISILVFFSNLAKQFGRGKSLRKWVFWPFMIFLFLTPVAMKISSHSQVDSIFQNGLGTKIVFERVNV